MNIPRWTPEKTGSLLSLGLGLAAFAAAYVAVSAELHPGMPAVTLASRASALAAFVLLPLTLVVGPLSSLRGLAPLALLRAPAGAALAGTALFHAVIAMRSHLGGARLALLSVFSSGGDLHSLGGLPFQAFGLLALIVLAAPHLHLLAATRHRQSLGLLAYGLVALHVALGPARADAGSFLRVLAWGGLVFVAAALALARVRGGAADAGPTAGEEPISELDEVMPLGAVPTHLAPKQLAWLRSLAVLGIAGAYALGAAAAEHQGPVDSGTRSAQAVDLEGILETSPLPMLRLKDGETLCLLGIGKRPVPVEASGDSHAPARSVRIHGRMLERRGWRWLEVAKDGIQDLGPAPAGSRRWIRRGLLSLQGEVLEPRCYFSSAWPSEGVLHRACADLGILSGSPPVLKVPHPDGAEDLYLLLDADGKPARDWVRGKVGTPVQAEGEEEEVDGWRVLRLGSADAVKRVK